MPDRPANPGLVAAGRSADGQILTARSQANRYRDQAVGAARSHSQRLRSLEQVFGPAVRAAAEEHLENLTESYSEAVYHLEEAIDRTEAERARLIEEIAHVRAVLTNTLADLGRALELPETMLERAERYFVHTRRARPTWLRDLASELSRLAEVDAEIVGEPF